MSRLLNARSARLGAGVLATGALVVLGSAVALAGGQNKVALRFNFKNGQKFKYATTMTMSSSGMPGAAGGAMDMNMSMVQNVAISAVNAKGFTSTTTVTDMKYNSSNPRMNEAMKNQNKQVPPVVATYDFTGKLLSGGVGGARQMGQMSGPSGFQGMNYSGGPVGVGSTWTITMDMSKANAGMGAPGMLKGIIPVKYTLKSFGTRGGAKTANISMTMQGTMTMAMGGGAVNSGPGASGGIKMNMDGAGTIVVDVATGTIFETKFNGNIVTNIQNMTIKQKVATSTVLK